MKLSTDIIYDHLSVQLELECFGNACDDLMLKSVLFYEHGMPIEEGQIYLAHHDNFPAAQPGHDRFLIVCVGGQPPEAWRNGNYPIFSVRTPVELPGLFNSIQAILSRYRDCDESLRNILSDDADISKMLLCSALIFENPLTVTNEQLEILGAIGYSPEQKNHWVLYDYHSIPLEYIERVRSVYGQYTNLKEPYLHDDNGHELVYSINLFIQEKYRGCVSMSELHRSFRRSDFALFRHFARYIHKALYYQFRVNHARFDSIKYTIRALLSGDYIEESQCISAWNEITTVADDLQYAWICLVLQPHDETSLIVPEYIIAALLERLPEGIALSHQDNIVLIVHLQSGASLQAMLDKIVPLLKNAGFHIGISDQFTHIHDIRVAYEKACCAIETGVMLGVKDHVYCFSNYVFAYMLQHAKGGFQIHDVLPSGLRALIRHDQEAAISYLETLRSYLSNQMNTTKTARELYLHRSSLVERLERIFGLLGTRLELADERLFYSMLLRLLENR